MDDAVDVPEEFTGSALTVPNVSRSAANGNTGTLYLRLRDDPDTVQTLNLPITSPVPGPNPVTADSAASITTTPGPAAKPDQAAPQGSSDASPSASKPVPKADSASTPTATPAPNL